MSSRDKILNAIKESKKNPSQIPDDPAGIDEKIQASLDSITSKDYAGLKAQFKKELEAISGEFYEAKSQDELADSIQKILAENNYTKLGITGDAFPKELVDKVLAKDSSLEIIDASKYEFTERKNNLAITPAALVDVAYAVADTASVAVLFDDTNSHLPHFLPDCVFVVIKPEQLLPNQFELFAKIPPEKAKNMLLVTGASRTADIEKILILGAHGPRRYIVYMLEE